ncbi:MAG: hypothetical protein ACRCX2_31890 [Paraclostridium sp.]
MSLVLTIEEVNERLVDRTWKCTEWNGTKNNNKMVCEVCSNKYEGRVDFRRFPPKCSCEWGIGVKEELDMHNFKFIKFDKKYYVQCNDCDKEYKYTKPQIKNKKYLCECERFRDYEENLKIYDYHYKITVSDEFEKVNVKCLECEEEFVVRMHGLVPNHNGRLKRVCECKKVLKPITKEQAQERIYETNNRIELIEWSSGLNYAKGKCEECGTLVETPVGNQLYTFDKYGFVLKRCVCKKITSKGEERVAQVLKELGIEFTNEKKYVNLKGIKNRALSFDFYLPEFNLLVEYDGEYHYRNDDEDKLKSQQENDKKKNEYAFRNNIDLLRIPYWDYDKIEKILKNIKNMKTGT